ISNRAGVLAVAIHYVDANVLITHQMIVESQISDLLAVRRHTWLLVGTDTMCERRDRRVGDRNLIDLRGHRIALPSFIPVSAHEDVSSIRCPGHRAFLVEGTERELTRKSTLGRDHKRMGEARLQIALSVCPVLHISDDS